MAQSKPPKCDGELRLDAEKMGREASLFSPRIILIFSILCFCIRFMLKGFQGCSSYDIDLH